MLEIKVKDNVSGIAKKVGKLSKNSALGLYAATSLVKAMEPYIPFRTGALSQSHKQQPWKVSYSAPYARPMYYGVVEGTSVRYTKEHHPQATSKWDKHIDKPSYAKQLEAYIKKVLR